MSHYPSTSCSGVYNDKSLRSLQGYHYTNTNTNTQTLQAEEIIVEEQAGFRAGRSTTEQIFNLRILCEKYLKRICTMSSLISKKPLTEYSMQPYGPPRGSIISVQV